MSCRTISRRETRHKLDGADEAGLLVSGLCLVHCLAMPVLLAASPAVGASLADPFVHRLFAVLAALSVLVGLFPPAIAHRRWDLAIIGSIGTLLLIFSAFGTSDACCSMLLALSENRLHPADVPFAAWVSLALTPAGCLLVALAHVLNRRRPQEQCCAGHERFEVAGCHTVRHVVETPAEVISLATTR